MSILIGYKHAANSCWLCFRYVVPTDNSFYACRSGVIPTDNSFMRAEVTSPNTLNSSLSNFVMAESTLWLQGLLRYQQKIWISFFMIKM